MIVANLDVIRVAIDEPKADTPLIVHKFVPNDAAHAFAALARAGAAR